MPLGKGIWNLLFITFHHSFPALTVSLKYQLLNWIDACAFPADLRWNSDRRRVSLQASQSRFMQHYLFLNRRDLRDSSIFGPNRQKCSLSYSQSLGCHTLSSLLVMHCLTKEGQKPSTHCVTIPTATVWQPEDWLCDKRSADCWANSRPASLPASLLSSLYFSCRTVSLQVVTQWL